ncbi:hypothetical protein HYX03_02475 [Candidatus Woesearchaeota archaeon]|nr:hypothetical protein [Candidatus Woesearchaeota archaeon]
MDSHIGETIRVADSYTRGLINDHVSVLHTSDLEQPQTRIYNVYARKDYNVGKGPRPIPRDMELGYRELLEEGEKPRGWGHVDTICKKKATLDEAMKLAEAEAKRRGVVLYLDDTTTTIRWHPDGWQPQLG